MLFLLAVLVNTPSLCASAQQIKRPFTVADDIGLALFDPGDDDVRFSPDGKYFAVYSERGRLDVNRVEDTLRFYRTQDIRDFLDRADRRQPPSPAWIVTRSACQESGSISHWRWSDDSSGIAYLECTREGNSRLVLADLRDKVVKTLSLPTESVEVFDTNDAIGPGTFDVHDKNNYVYSGIGPTERKVIQAERSAERRAPAIVGTGDPLETLLFPDDSNGALWSGKDSRYGEYGHLSAVVAGKRFEEQNVVASHLALSPDGHSVVAQVPVPSVPHSWGKLYPAPFASDAYHFIAGAPVHQFVRIDLQTGSIHSLTGAPISEDAGLWPGVFAAPSWSHDSQAILLPGTFLKSKNNLPSQPCAAVVVDLLSNTRSCVEMLKRREDMEGGHGIHDIRFVNGERKRVIVTFLNSDYHSIGGTTEYRQAANGAWQMVAHTVGYHDGEHGGLDVMIRQRFNEPPSLVASEKGRSRIIWDPNPQLQHIAMGEASIYRWKDKDGRDWEGGLYKPVNYKPGERYPLVIQTHGFIKSEFAPSGIFPSGLAARELAGAGIAVLQITEGQKLCPYATPQEVPGCVSGYDAAADHLVAEGLADPEKIGIIGFSRTGTYVMSALTSGTIRFKAAIIEDADLVSYFNYFMGIDTSKPVALEDNPAIGAPPFGAGLQMWLKKTSGFNLEKITAPLRIVVNMPHAFLLEMWQPYAGLRYLHKPVDLIVLNADNAGELPGEHVLTLPAWRLVAQAGSVDWFRFWLQGYEDPDPSKRVQYKRWEGLRKLQQTDEAKTAATNQ